MLKKYSIAVLALASIGTLPSAQAETAPVDDRFYVAPFGSFIRTDGGRDNQDGWGGGLGFGKMLDQHFNVELKGYYQEFENKQSATPAVAGRESRFAGGSADVLYFFTRDTFAPYTVVGVGGMSTRNASNNLNRGDSAFTAEAGAGFTYELTDNFLLRSDVRYRYSNHFNDTPAVTNDEFHDVVVNMGFVVPIGRKPSLAKYEAPVPVPAPAPAAPDCSTLDSDADGINDCTDQCPSTLTGSKVDNLGCPVSLELRGVNFRVDSAELTPSAMGILDKVAENLINYPQKDDIEVHGHTSSEASFKHNMKLSERRSQSVANYLQMKGVTNRLIAKGFGEGHPIADNNTEEGRMQNRRVELIWMGN